jgi:hypothetical protein
LRYFGKSSFDGPKRVLPGNEPDRVLSLGNRLPRRRPSYFLAPSCRSLPGPWDGIAFVADLAGAHSVLCAIAPTAPYARMRADIVTPRTRVYIWNLLKNTPLPINSPRAISILWSRFSPGTAATLIDY